MEENPCRASSQLHQFSLDVDHKFSTLASTLVQLETRIGYLKLIGNISSQLDRIGNEIRSLSSLSERRFMASCEDEDDGCWSLQSAVDEHKQVLDKIKSFEMEVDGLREETQRASTNHTSGGQAVPGFMGEKIKSVGEMIRQTLSHELDRRSSLLELKQLEDHRLMKIKSLNRNLEILHTILTNNLKNG